MSCYESGLLLSYLELQHNDQLLYNNSYNCNWNCMKLGQLIALGKRTLLKRLNMPATSASFDLFHCHGRLDGQTQVPQCWSSSKMPASSSSLISSWSIKTTEKKIRLLNFWQVENSEYHLLKTISWKPVLFRFCTKETWIWQQWRCKWLNQTDLTLFGWALHGSLHQTSRSIGNVLPTRVLEFWLVVTCWNTAASFYQHGHVKTIFAN